MPESAGSARKGKATEALIAAMCVLASGGELNALTALVDDEGVDLGLKRRNGTRTLDVQVKSGFIDERKSLREKGTFIADVRCETFKPRDDLYMLYVVIDGSRAEVIRTWLVPSEVLDARGIRGPPARQADAVTVQSLVPGSGERGEGVAAAVRE
jgi:hypothetical protein